MRKLLTILLMVTSLSYSQECNYVKNEYKTVDSELEVDEDGDYVLHLTERREVITERGYLHSNYSTDIAIHTSKINCWYIIYFEVVFRSRKEKRYKVDVDSTKTVILHTSVENIPLQVISTNPSNKDIMVFVCQIPDSRVNTLSRVDVHNITIPYLNKHRIIYPIENQVLKNQLNCTINAPEPK